jgi:hypothetical protein
LIRGPLAQLEVGLRANVEWLREVEQPTHRAI